MTDFTCTIEDELVEISADGFYFILINPNISFPHLALVYHNYYFSLSIKKLSLEEDFSSRWSSLLRSKQRLLIFQLKDEFKQEAALDVLNNSFNSDESLSKKGVTCLNPIRRALSNLYQLDYNAETVLDLLPQIIHTNNVLHCYSSGIPKGNFVLNTYSRIDVQTHIAALLR